MAKRKAFNFYNSHWEQIKLLNKKQQLELFISICKVQFLEINIEDIEFKDNISTLVWTGLKHSIDTSINGFVSKQKGLNKVIDIPLTKGLGKGGGEAPCIEEQGEEKEEEEEKEEPKKVFSDEIKNFTASLSKLFPENIITKLTDSQKRNWIDTIDKLIRIDKFTKQQIEKAIKAGRKDEFWSKQFLSMNKLRKLNKDDIKYINVFLNLNGHQQTTPQLEEIKLPQSKEIIIKHGMDG